MFKLNIQGIFAPGTNTNRERETKLKNDQISLTDCNCNNGVCSTLAKELQLDKAGFNFCTNNINDEK